MRIYSRFDMRESDQCRYVEMPGISDKIADVEMRQISSRIRVLSMTHSFRVMFRPIATSIQTAIRMTLTVPIRARAGVYW